MGIFNWHYLSSPPQIHLRPGVGLEAGGLISNTNIILYAVFGVWYIIKRAAERQQGAHSNDRLSAANTQ